MITNWISQNCGYECATNSIWCFVIEYFLFMSIMTFVVITLIVLYEIYKTNLMKWCK